jgi:predicted transglutaminase-like cysteine proteinase
MRWVYPIFLFGTLILSSPAMAREDGFALFLSREERSGDLKPFPKWTGMIERMNRTNGKRCTDGGCHQQSWENISFTSDTNNVETLRVINERFNRADYILDIKNWGISDYWASPLQFLIKDGDCEDYAIAKYMALRHLGWPPEKMRIVVLQDENLNILHSVLAVREEGSIYILDNQIPSVVTDRQIHHYRPIYSINEQAWWRHLP